MKKILTLVCLCVFLAPASQAQGNKAFNALKRIGQKAHIPPNAKDIC